MTIRDGWSNAPEMDEQSSCPVCNNTAPVENAFCERHQKQWDEMNHTTSYED